MLIEGYLKFELKKGASLEDRNLLSDATGALEMARNRMHPSESADL